MSVENVLQMIKDNKVEFVDLMFGDLFGTLQHVTFPAGKVNAEFFENGAPFDGSSIRGWKSIDKSDMLLKPDPTTAFLDPFRERSTVAIFCDVYEPRTGQRYERDPRSIAWKCLQYLKSLGLGDQVYFGPEPEFFIFDGIRYGSDPLNGFYEIRSGEHYESAREDDGMNLGHKIRLKQGYFPVTPQDTLMDLRCEIVTNMMHMGIDVELHHHEVAAAGQCEVGTKFGTIITAADQVHKIKYAVKNTCYQHGKTATFMPKPYFGDNGSGMHCHTSIWKEGKNLYAGKLYGNLSQTAHYAIGGILKHGRSIQALTNPTVNSYRRLIPGFEAPVNLAYSATNRSATIRIPHVQGDKARRFEFRCPDSSGSPYLVMTAITMAMVDGIVNKIDPGQPMDKNIYDLPPEELAGIPSTCNGLEEAIKELEADHDWLTAGDVFSKELLDSYIDYKKEVEINPLKLRPNPYEYHLYYDA